jgi:folylpolyglutamate synthase
LARLPSNAAIQAGLLSKKLDNSNSLPEMRALLRNFSSTKGDLQFLKAIHVAGSKGKGSVCAFAERLLRDVGMKTGMFTSPHLVHPRERIRINGQAVREELFAHHVLRMDSKLQEGGQNVSFFRFMWLVAIEIFAEERIDTGIIEVGIGGRYDATNVIDNPVCCGITSLAMEHVAILGPSLRDIALHKTGIMKPHVPVFTDVQSEEAMDVIMSESCKVGSPLHAVSRAELPENCSLGLSGEHQYGNAALALGLARQWIKSVGPSLCLTEDLVRSALMNAQWPGRQQLVLINPETVLFLDGSHTLESVLLTTKWFKQHTSSGPVKRILLFHCSADRDWERLLRPLETCGVSFDAVYFVIPNSSPPGSGSAESLLQHHRLLADHWNREVQLGTAQTFPSFKSVWLEVGKIPGPKDVLVCGSLYLVGTVMSELKLET